MGFAKSGRRRGFTLIELLVVVSIIALLISILIPGLTQAKRHAKAVACSANISGLLKATSVYFPDNNDSYPWNGLEMFKTIKVASLKSPTSPPYNFPQFDDTAPNANNISALEYGVLMGSNLVTNKKSFICPDDDLARSNSTNALQFSGNKYYPDAPTTSVAAGDNSANITVGAGPNGYWSYSVNSVCNSAGRLRTQFLQNVYNANGTADTSQPWMDPLKSINVRNPTDFIVFIEEAATSNFNDEVFDPIMFNQGDALTDRHDHGGNLGYQDGHVEKVSSVLFNEQGTTITDSHKATMRNAMSNSPFTRQFFPDNGDFAF